ncbi:hypothetical protein ONS96_012479 [Cadophora gregata f. sp. sojae]|nr:hypothetical protein ONS96_012479 [Cadophora gregata f. sp. sojae]
MTWSTQTFGPDGPWQAVEIQVGSNEQVISLYPGGIFSSHFLSPKVCSNSTLGNVCYAQTAGLYDKQLSSSQSFANIQFQAQVDYTGGALQIDGKEGDIDTDTWRIGKSMEPLVGMDMAYHDSLWGILPDGSYYLLSVGSLALGAPGTINQTFDSHNATLLPGWQSTLAPSSKIIASNSYGLHIGSASQNIPPSLYFGGFDQNRVLGEVSTQQGPADSVDSIDLFDISLNVIQGDSPWDFVSINSLAPYLHLPRSTCDAIAARLPLKYQEKYGLYFWDTEDPKYTQIISSPSCLTFTFRQSQTEKNPTINVPFKLLNLTLTAPLSTTPTSYFPCKAETQTHYQLGRAFLQAAFVGGNWNADNGSATWWLAQAPGPNLPSQANVIAVGDEDRSIIGSAADWASTWKGSWKALASEEGTNVSTTSTGTGSDPVGTDSTVPSNPPSTPRKPSQGLSTGAKAGIEFGAAAGIVGIIAAILFLWWKRSWKNKPETPDYSVQSLQQPMASPGMTSSTPNSPPQMSAVSSITLMKPEYRNSGFRPVEIEAGDATLDARSEMH